MRDDASAEDSGPAQNQGIFFERAKDQPFEKAELLMRISKPPAIRFTDLKEKVTAKVTYNTLPFRLGCDFVQLDSQSYLVPVTFGVHLQRSDCHSPRPL